MAIVSRGLGRGLITGALVAFGLGIAPHQVDVPAQATAVQQEGNGGTPRSGVPSMPRNLQPRRFWKPTTERS